MVCACHVRVGMTGVQTIYRDMPTNGYLCRFRRRRVVCMTIHSMLTFAQVTFAQVFVQVFAQLIFAQHCMIGEPHPQ
jgi:hypothetical protein